MSKEQEVDILARTIYGEARGEVVRCKEAVACVVLNRARRAKRRGGYWWGGNVIEVCQKPWQFSCWDEDRPTREKILNLNKQSCVFRTCMRVAQRAIAGTIKDPTSGATHYHDAGVEPPWARGREPSVTIGRLSFYNDIE